MTKLHELVVNDGALDALRFFIEEAQQDDSFVIDEKNDLGETALHVAAKYGHADYVIFLAEKGASLDSMDNAGHDPLHKACRSGDLMAVKYIRRNAKNLFDEACDNNSYLHEACYGGNSEIVGYVCKHFDYQFSDFLLFNDDRKTPIDIACQRNKLTILQHFQEGCGEALQSKIDFLESEIKSQKKQLDKLSLRQKDMAKKAESVEAHLTSIPESGKIRWKHVDAAHDAEKEAQEIAEKAAANHAAIKMFLDLNKRYSHCASQQQKIEQTIEKLSKKKKRKKAPMEFNLSAVTLSSDNSEDNSKKRRMADNFIIVPATPPGSQEKKREQ